MHGKALSLGFIGGSWKSAVGATHFIAARMDGHFSVDAGVFSRDSATNSQTGERWGLDAERVHPDLDAFLADEHDRLDAVVVLTPTPDHIEPVLRALDCGLPVICEKALAATVMDARRIHDAVTRHAGFLAVTYNYTGYPMLRELRRLVRSGELGDISQVQVEMPQEGFARLGADGKPVVPQAWRLRDGSVPTISLDLGVHVLHMVSFITGAQPEEVLAMHGNHGNFTQVVDNVNCLARYSAGIDCAIWYSKAALGHRNGLRIRIYGSRGSAEWFQMDPEALQLHDHHGQRRLHDRACIDAVLPAEARYNRFKAGHPAGFMEAFANLYADIAVSLQARRNQQLDTNEYVFSTADALSGLLTLEAMSTSARTRAWTRVPGPDA